jgi:hypothetical protein
LSLNRQFVELIYVLKNKMLIYENSLKTDSKDLHHANLCWNLYYQLCTK